MFVFLNHTYQSSPLNPQVPSMKWSGCINMSCLWFLETTLLLVVPGRTGSARTVPWTLCLEGRDKLRSRKRPTLQGCKDAMTQNRFPQKWQGSSTGSKWRWKRNITRHNTSYRITRRMVKIPVWSTLKCESMTRLLRFFLSFQIEMMELNTPNHRTCMANRKNFNI